MKHTALPAALMAWLTTTALAGALNVHEKEFVTAAVLTAHVLDHCKDYEVVADGFLPFGDLNGIDPRTGRAVFTAFKMFAGMAHDRNLTDPRGHGGDDRHRQRGDPLRDREPRGLLLAVGTEPDEERSSQEEGRGRAVRQVNNRRSTTVLLVRNAL